MAVNKLIQLKDSTTQEYNKLYPVVVKQSIQDTQGNPISVAQTKQVEAIATRVTAIQQSVKGGAQAFITITELPQGNLIKLQGVPVGVRTSTGNYYPLQKETYNPDTGELDLSTYLLYEQNIFTSPWLIYYTSQLAPVLQGNYLDVSAIDGYIIVPDQTVPVSVQINGIVVDIDQTWLLHQGTTFKLLQAYILAAANLPSYTGTYRVWRAGGQKGDQGQRGPMGQIAFQGLTQQQIEQIRGPQGQKGQKGDQGARGPQGIQGQQGIQGPANTLTIGTVTTLNPEQSATAQITGESPNQVLSLGLPRGPQGIQGQQGIQGPANTLTIGTVTTLDNGVAATAQITGESPNQVLSLGLPRGPQGIQGQQGIQGVQGQKGDKGDQGIPGEPIQANYLDIEAIDGYIVVPDQTIPVSVQINNKVIDIDQDWMVHQGATFKILQGYILATAGLASYQGTYRVWRAGGKPGQDASNTYVLCLCQQSPDALFDGMIWVKGGTNTPKYVTAVGGTKVLTTEPSDISKLSNGTFIITEE